jgi:hypothetical protein
MLALRLRKALPPATKDNFGRSATTAARALFSPFLLLLLCVAVNACKPTAAAPPPLAPEAVPATLERAFADAPADVGVTVQAVAQAARQQDPEAVLVLMDLSSRPQLTPEQRAALAASMNGLLDQARQRAAQGDVHAAAVVEKYRASK